MGGLAVSHGAGSLCLISSWIRAGALNTDSRLSTEPPGQWLQTFLEQAVAENMCVEVGCTTCGNGSFAAGLMRASGCAMNRAPAQHRQPYRRFGWPRFYSHEVATAL